MNDIDWSEVSNFGETNWAMQYPVSDNLGPTTMNYNGRSEETLH